MHGPAHDDREALRARLLGLYEQVRATTERLAAPLSPEDQGVQSMASCSPTRWHRAHTTWFFETFLLAPAGVAPYDARWGALFNSYYEALGPRHARGRRGVLSRPGAAEIGGYRRHVDAQIQARLEHADASALASMAPLVELGVAHEEQHQELLLTDALHALAQNPLRPSYRAAQVGASAPLPPASEGTTAARWHAFEGGLVEIGAPGDGSFRFDHEEPRHRVFLAPYELADRLVTVAEWKAFADAGGYDTPALWLADGLDWARANEARAPEYARREGGALVMYDLEGEREARDDEPIAHLSFFEADALARFLGARLPTEQEWEHAAQGRPIEGNLLDDDRLRVLPAAARSGADGTLRQLFGDAWEWTVSAYAPYPGFRPRDGALAEYNGKFMSDQRVLRGGSCLTPRRHLRASYRNYWPAATRFQRTGVRLAR
jgi:ergothioneine biosynthesis protein EgtB